MKQKIISEIIHSRINQGWLAIDRDYRVIYINEMMCQWLNQDMQTLVGKSLLGALYQGKKRDGTGQYFGPLIETMDTGIEHVRTECTLKANRGHNWFLANTYLLKNEKGKNELAVGTYVVIDKYKMLEEALDNINFSIIKSFAEAIGARDNYTKAHSEGVAGLMLELAQYMGMNPPEARRSYLIGLVHDIGKIGIPEHILNKPGRLTDEEFSVIQQHPVIGANILCKISGFEDICTAVRHHHERYDGGGYPDKLHRADVPMYSRMLAVCDTYDAMTNARCYRQPFTELEAIKEIERCAATQFDPAISDMFITMLRTGRVERA